MDSTTKLASPWNRTEESMGNVVELQHVNLQIPDQLKATAFYVSALGLTRDPYLMTGIDNMWANAGISQFHLPTGPAQVLRGTTGLVLPDRAQLLHRLDRARRWLEGTQYAFVEAEDHVDVTCPWGNRMRCHVPDAEKLGRITLGMPYVEFDVAYGTLPGIARFYEQIIGTSTAMRDGLLYVRVAREQFLTFRETDKPQPAFDGHHVQLAFVDFGGIYSRLNERGLISREDSAHQYRFINVVDPNDGRVLFEVEHEIRSMTHPLFMRPLVNRNAAISNNYYSPGNEAAVAAMPPG